MISPEEKQRTADKLNDPALIDDVVNYVSVGNSLIDLCEIWQVTYYVVSNYLYKHHKEAYEAALMTRGEWIDQRILDEIKSIGLVDIREAYDESGRLKDPNEWPAGLTRAVSAIESHENIDKEGNITGYTKRIKLWDKIKALELLGKNRNLFADDDRRGPMVVQVFQNLGAPRLSVEERINAIEASLRKQLSE